VAPPSLARVSSLAAKPPPRHGMGDLGPGPSSQFACGDHPLLKPTVEGSMQLRAQPCTGPGCLARPAKRLRPARSSVVVSSSNGNGTKATKSIQRIIDSEGALLIPGVCGRIPVGTMGPFEQGEQSRAYNRAMMGLQVSMMPSQRASLRRVGTRPASSRARRWVPGMASSKMAGRFLSCCPVPFTTCSMFPAPGNWPAPPNCLGCS
jgi:hypothetical protein